VTDSEAANDIIERAVRDVHGFVASVWQQSAAVAARSPVPINRPGGGGSATVTPAPSPTLGQGQLTQRTAPSGAPARMTEDAAREIVAAALAMHRHNHAANSVQLTPPGSQGVVRRSSSSSSARHSASSGGGSGVEDALSAVHAGLARAKAAASGSYRGSSFALHPDPNAGVAGGGLGPYTNGTITMGAAALSPPPAAPSLSFAFPPMPAANNKTSNGHGHGHGRSAPSSGASSVTGDSGGAGHGGPSGDSLAEDPLQAVIAQLTPKERELWEGVMR
jgi:hypothetical protein